MRSYKPLPIAIVGLLAAAMLFLPAPAGSAPTAVPALALTFLVIGLMAAGAMPELHFAFLFFALALVFQIAPAEAVFSGFRAGAFWLVVGGIVLGMAAERTRLGTWVAAIFLRRADGTLAKAVAGLSIGAVVLGFLIPAALARVIILIPIVQSMADRMGFPPGSRGRRAMLLSVVMISFFVPMAILPANFPNVLLSGMSDSLYGVDMTYGLYMLANFPIAGALKGLLVVGVILYWFRDRVRIADAPPPDRPPLSPAGRRLAVIVLATVTAWATDFWHGVSPGWVTITAAVICLMPVVGVLTPDDLKGRTSAFTAVFTVATVIGLGAVMAAAGAGDMIAHLLLDATDFGSGNAPYVYTVFSAINIAMMLFATIPGAITVMVPFAGTVAEAAQLPVLGVLMMVVNGYATAFFPYQASPLLAGLRIGGIGFADGTKITFTVSTVTVIVLLPLTYLWWDWLGFFG